MPSWFRRLRARIKYRRYAEELPREIAIHRELAAQTGAGDRDARRRVALQMGNTTLAIEDSRAVWVSRRCDELRQDLIYAARTMRREWGFAITATTTLALGIGVLLSVFTVFSAIYMQPWPVRDAARVFGISASPAVPTADTSPRPMSRVSYAALEQIRSSLTTADLVAKRDFNGTLRPAATGRGRSGRFGLVDDQFLETIGVPFYAGNLGAESAPPALVISHSTWVSLFGRDASILGRQVWIGAEPVVITGVLREDFLGFGERVYDGFLRLRHTSRWLAADNVGDLLTNPAKCCIDTYGRLRPGATRENAAVEIESRVNAANATFAVPALRVFSWSTEFANGPGGTASGAALLFTLLFTGAGFVTLLACANIANLQLARGLRRGREIAVRLSLGAGRMRIVRQLLTESAALAFLATSGAFAIAWVLPHTVMSRDPGGLAVSFLPDGRVAAFAIFIGVLTTVLFGVAPALRVTHIDWRAGGRTATTGAGKLRGVLLGVQVALSFGLIASAALLSRGAIHAAGGANAGFTFQNRYAYNMIVPGDDEGAIARRRGLRDAISNNPSLALAEPTPWRSSQPKPMVSTPGSTQAVISQWAGFNAAAISLLELPLAEGRWPDDDSRAREVVVSRSLSRALWGDESALGRTINTKHPFDGNGQYTVVGLMGEVQLSGPDPMPAAIVAYQDKFLATILAGPGREKELQQLAERFDPAARVMSRPLVENLRSQMRSAFTGISIAGGLGAIAMLLASLGIFGVFAYIVEERRREIGVRLALGATRAHVRRSISAVVRWPLGFGLAAGLGLSLIAGVVLRGSLFGLSILDPLAYVAVAIVLTSAALAATFIPLRRAVRVDPAITLRDE